LQLVDEVVQQFAYKPAMGCAQRISVLVDGQLADQWHHRHLFDQQDVFQHDRYVPQGGGCMRLMISLPIVLLLFSTTTAPDVLSDAWWYFDCQNPGVISAMEGAWVCRCTL
jgi:hypothetical protein